MAQRPDSVGESIFYALAVILMHKGAEKATAFTRSKSLKRNGIYGYIISYGKDYAISATHTPYYWARFLHNGRGSMTMREKKLTYFKDFDEDPRYKGIRPKHRSDLKKMTQSQYRLAVKRKQLVFRTSVGPTAASKQDPFFSNTGGMEGLVSDCKNEILEEANFRVKRVLDRLPKSIDTTVSI